MGRKTKTGLLAESNTCAYARVRLKVALVLGDKTTAHAIRQTNDTYYNYSVGTIAWDLRVI